MSEELMEEIEKINRKKFYSMADQRIIDFHERFIDIIGKIFKGKVIFRFNIGENNYEMIYELHLDIGKNYGTSITFYEILNFNFNSSEFINAFIDYVKHDYLRNILN